MKKENKAPITIDVLTAQELEQKGNLKFMNYGGRVNYIAIYEHQHYALIREPNKSYYERILK
jgi:hypothetical protein